MTVLSISALLRPVCPCQIVPVSAAAAAARALYLDPAENPAPSASALYEARTCTCTDGCPRFAHVFSPRAGVSSSCLLCWSPP